MCICCRQTVTCTRDGTIVYWKGGKAVSTLTLHNPTKVLCKTRNSDRIDCTYCYQDQMLFGVASGVFSHTPGKAMEPRFSHLHKNDWVYSLLVPSHGIGSNDKLLAVIGCELHVLQKRSREPTSWQRYSMLIRENRSSRAGKFMKLRYIIAFGFSWQHIYICDQYMYAAVEQDPCRSLVTCVSMPRLPQLGLGCQQMHMISADFTP